MSTYTNKVEANLAGCVAVSTGVCPGCDECREHFDDYKVREFEGTEVNPEPFYSFNASADSHAPGILIAYTSEERAEDASRAQFADDWHGCDFSLEASFSKSECGICGSRLAGNREVWHWVNKREDGSETIVHETDACCDCVAYLANGTEPEREEEESEEL